MKLRPENVFYSPNFPKNYTFGFNPSLEKKKGVGRCVFADIIVIHIEKSKKNSKIGITDNYNHDVQ